MKRALAVALGIALISFAFVLGNFSGPNEAQVSLHSPSGFDGAMWNSTLVLYGTMGKSTHAVCTAEVIGKILGGYQLLSAGHCVQLLPEGTQFSASREIGSPRTKVTMVKAYMDGNIDMSLFNLVTKEKYSVMQLGLDTDLQIGDEVVNPNFAAGFGKQLSHGEISSDLLEPSEMCDDTCVGDFLVQVYGAGGSSGSAIVSETTHKIIGLVIWHDPEPGADIGLGIEPISNFALFMAGPNQPHPAPDDDDEIN